jgi:cytochrome c553
LRTQIVFGVLIVLAALAAPATLAAQAGPAAQAAPANTAEGTPDPTTDREFSAKLSVCNACHDVNGRRKYANIPVIWGQQENYLLKQLRDFESGARTDEVMLWMAKSLTPQELRVAATYFAKQTWPARSAGAASPPPAPPGIAVCRGCHDTPAAPAGRPKLRISGEAMRRFAEGERKQCYHDQNDAVDAPRRPGGDGALPVRSLIGTSVTGQMFRRLLLMSYSRLIR